MLSPTPTQSPTPPSDLNIRSRPVQIALAFLLGIAVALISVRLFGGRFTSPVELDPHSISAYRVDLNRAGVGELRQIHGIGPGLADRIIAARPFGSEGDLQRVPGIGPSTYQRVSPHVTVGESQFSVSAKQPFQLIDPNIATLDELQSLPGIGPKMAQRIVDERNRKPFDNVEALRRVAGIGAKTLEKLRPFVAIASP